MVSQEEEKRNIEARMTAERVREVTLIEADMNAKRQQVEKVVAAEAQREAERHLADAERIRLVTGAEAQRDAAQRGFPALLDGLALSLEAGQSLGQALLLASQRSAQEASSPWRQMVKTFAIEIRGGASRAAAVARLQAALPIAVVQQFGALVLVAEQAGLSMGKILRAQASQARRVYQLQIEARAMSKLRHPSSNIGARDLLAV